MIPFLQQTAQYISNTFQNDFEDLCIVLPNRRAGLFLRKYLGDAVGKVTWAPAMLSIEDFITSVSGLLEVDQMILIFELYEVHREIDGEKAQEFEEFVHWAPQLLSDFGELDRYLADPDELFSTLTEARAISLWNPNGQPLTEFEKEYLRFYQSLNIYYKKLSDRLLAKNQAYQGLIFRHVAENIDRETVNMAWKHVVFAGFNAMTKAEEKIVGTLRDRGMATLLWDADRYYISNEKQEAGDFLRNWLKKWPVKEPRWINNYFAEEPKRISIIGSPDPVGQAKYCGSLMKEFAIQNQANENTAVVLLDVSLLMPLLNSIPDEVTSLNITAGLPLNQTSLANFFDAVFNMHIHASRYKGQTSAKGYKFYYQDVLKLVQHPIIQLMADGNEVGNFQALTEATSRIRYGGQSFITFHDLIGDQKGLFGINLKFIEPIFNHWNSASDAISCFKILIETLRASISGKIIQLKSLPENAAYTSLTIEMEYVYAFSGILHQFTNLLKIYPKNLKIQSFNELFKQITSNTTLPFYGEPLKGIQIMGMLETRTLDFENLVILSCNDDLLPAGKTNSSFIPLDIKRNFGLPTYRHKDSVYSYHFYRLLQRAKNVWILYNTENDQLGGGDKSRFVRQIVEELPKYNQEISISENILTTPITGVETSRIIEIPKTGATITALENKAKKGLSASSLNSFRNCPLKFYYAEIAGIREPDEITDNIDPAIMGTAVHAALNELYKPLLNNSLTIELLQSLLPLSENATLRAFERKYKTAEIAFGKNLLLINVAKLLVKKMIKFDIDELKNQQKSSEKKCISFLEYPLTTNIVIPFNNGDLTVNLKGFLDRVDIVDGHWKIIDYKTGLTDSRNIKVKDWDDLVDNSELNIGFQLLMYGFLLKSTTKSDFSDCTSGIISLRKLSSGFIAVSVPSKEPGKLTTLLSEDSISGFEEVLTSILMNIYDVSIPFRQTDNLKICENCPYINLCGR